MFSAREDSPDSNGKFPDDFLFGAATSALQIEGAWNIDGKGPSIWDKFTHENPEKIADGKNMDDAADSYHFYRHDIEAVKTMGVSDYWGGGVYKKNQIPHSS